MFEGSFSEDRIFMDNVLCSWYNTIANLAEQARDIGDRKTEILAQDVAEAINALADRLQFISCEPARTVNADLNRK